MTRTQAIALLDDFLDDALPEEDRQAVSELVDSDPVVRREFELAVAVRESLRQQPPPDPGSAYWREVHGLILARTIESDTGHSVPSQAQVQGRRTYFIRSLVSVAASIFILVSALLIGSDRNLQAPTVVTSDSPVLINSSLATLLSEENTQVITATEQLQIARGIFLIGPPGILGRTSQFSGFMIIE